MKNRIAKTLLAGTASLALLASPALAVDALAPAGKVLAQTGGVGVEGATGAAGSIGAGQAGVGGKGAVGIDGNVGAGTSGGSAGAGASGSVGTSGAVGGAAGTSGNVGAGASGSAGTADTGGTIGGTGAAETTGSVLGASSADPTALLTQRGYTDIVPVEDAATAAADMSGHSTFKARNSTGNQVELVVDNATGVVIHESTMGAKNQ
ncbi:MAG: hypothetical protein KF769_05520 [Parvibaculum sp.]|nr:hypothetical protein [Parvibaculum sp.]